MRRLIEWVAIVVMLWAYDHDEEDRARQQWIDDIGRERGAIR